MSEAPEERRALSLDFCSASSEWKLLLIRWARAPPPPRAEPGEGVEEARAGVLGVGVQGRGISSLRLLFLGRTRRSRDQKACWVWSLGNGRQCLSPNNENPRRSGVSLGRKSSIKEGAVFPAGP